MKYYFFFSLAILTLPLRAQTQKGEASFYSDKFEGKRTASGETYQGNRLTAAHKTLPFGTIVKVTNLANNESVNVVINDRGPYVDGRIIDLSRAAAKQLNYLNRGTAEVKIEILAEGNGKEKTEPAAFGHAAAEEKEFYNFDITKVQPKGFGVQLGSYQELASLFHIIDDLKTAYKKKAVVQVKVVKGLTYYSLILGPFSSQGKAESFVSGLKKQFPDAFVLDLSLIHI